MARRRGRGRKQAKGKAPSKPAAIMKPQNATSIGSLSSRVHPAVTDPYPLNKLCRLCLLSNGNMEPIFAYPGDRILANKIFQCTNLEIKENSDQGIPTAICGGCKKLLEQCHEFRLVCWKNNEVLHNLHALLSPRKALQPSNNNPLVQLEKLNLRPSDNLSNFPLQSLTSPRSFRQRESLSGKSFNIRDLPQLYSPSRMGRNSAKSYPLFSRELVVRLSPLSRDVLNKYKKVTRATKHVQQTKAAVKSFPQPTPPKRGRPPATSKYDAPKVTKEKKAKPVAKVMKRVIPKIVVPPKKVAPKKVVPKKVVPKKIIPKKVAKPPAKVVKAKKVKKVEIAVPPKKRKENYPVAVSLSASCTLCSQKFTTEKGLRRHIASHDSNRKTNNVFNCNICKREYLKPTQLTAHMASLEHIQNTTVAPDEGGVSILPDEEEEEPDVSILPDDEQTTQPIVIDEDEPMESGQNQSTENGNVTPPATADDPQSELPNESADAVDHCQPSPDTNEVSQPPENDEPIPEEEPIEEPADPEPTPEENPNRDASPIPVESESSRSREGGVQYSDVCSTNNAEVLVENGNGTADEPSDSCNNSTRRVTFSDVAEIVE